MTWFDDALTQIAQTHPEDAEKLRGQGIPGPKSEGWQHSGLRQFFAVERRLLLSTKGLHPSSLPVAEGPCVVLWNGRFMPQASHLPNGVRVETADAEAFPSMNVFDGIARGITPAVVLHIDQTQVQPLALYSYIEGVLPSMVCQAVTIRVAEHMEARVHMQSGVLGVDPGHLLCASMHADLATGARLELADVPSEQQPTTIRTTRANVKFQGHFERFMLGNPSGLLREDMETNLDHATTAHLNGLLLQQSLTTSVASRVYHTGPHAVSSQSFRSCVFGDARVAVDVETEVDRDATDTEAAQESRHLLLGPRARAFTIPRLIINTDDVRCKHGATVGHADSQQLAYMRARGIGDQRARSLLAYGHLSALLETYPEAIRPLVDAQLRHHLLLS